MTYYYGSFTRDWHDALDNFRVREWVEYDNGLYLGASADTGSRYTMFSTRVKLPEHPLTTFVTVMQPWQNAWTLQWEGLHYYDYVDEHLRSPRHDRHESHGGDLAAVTLGLHLITGWKLEDAMDKCRAMMLRPELTTAQN